MSYRTPKHRGVSFGPRDVVVGRRWWLAAVTGVVLAAVAAAPNAARATSASPPRAGSAREGRRAQDNPTQVIDAQANPDAAAQAINAGCADLLNCRWQTDPGVTVDYGPSKILGDVLYNCSDPATEPDADADTAVGVSDERAETTSLSEKVSVKASVDFLGLAKASVEFEAFSQQAETFSTEVTATNAVAVPPGYKGWTETQVLTASVTGNAYVTEGINLIEVKGIDLGFPGYENPNDPRSEVIYNGFSKPMTADDIATRCNAALGLGIGGAHGFLAPTGTFKLTVCRRPVSLTATVRRSPVQAAACRTKKVTAPPPPRLRKAAATLTRDGRIYATGTDTGGRIRLTRRRPIRAGKYTLFLREHHPATHHRRRQEQHLTTTIVQIAIR